MCVEASGNAYLEPGSMGKSYKKRVKTAELRSAAAGGQAYQYREGEGLQKYGRKREKTSDFQKNRKASRGSWEGISALRFCGALRASPVQQIFLALSFQ